VVGGELVQQCCCLDNQQTLTEACWAQDPSARYVVGQLQQWGCVTAWLWR
jgi:hypothetical protein